MVEFLTIASLHLFAVASPGPDFILVVRQCFRYGKRGAIWTSLGISVGILVHVCISLIGIGLILSLKPEILSWLKILASIYIAYLGLNSIINTSFLNLEKNESSSLIVNLKSFTVGIITNILNPKAFVFFITVFTLVINPSTPKPLQLFYGLYMSVATFLWFSFISFIFTNQVLILKYVNYLPWLERLMGSVLVIIAIHILFF